MPSVIDVIEKTSVTPRSTTPFEVIVEKVFVMSPDKTFLRIAWESVPSSGAKITTLTLEPATTQSPSSLRVLIVTFISPVVSSIVNSSVLLIATSDPF